MVLRVANTDGTRTLKQQERAEREVFWRGVLERELTSKWFKAMPEEVKKQFNLKTIGELHDTSSLPSRGSSSTLMEGRKSSAGEARTGVRSETELPDGKDRRQSTTLQPQNDDWKALWQKEGVGSMEQHSAETDWFR